MPPVRLFEDGFELLANLGATRLRAVVADSDVHAVSAAEESCGFDSGDKLDEVADVDLFEGEELLGGFDLRVYVEIVYALNGVRLNEKVLDLFVGDFHDVPTLRL